MQYNAHAHRLPREFWQAITKLEAKRSTWALIAAWAALAFLVTTYRFIVPSETKALLYVPFIFLIAGRFGALLQLAHEGAHGLINPKKSINLFLSRWFCTYPIGVVFEGYAAGHMKHHAGTNTPLDPPADTEKYRITDCRNPKLYLLFLKDLLGITAFEIFFAYKSTGDESSQKTGQSSEGLGAKIKSLSLLAIAQCFVISILFQFNLFDYILLWIFPAISAHMFLMRIRGMAEHGLAQQMGVEIKTAEDGNLYTRSFFTKTNHYRFVPLIWLERILIGSLNVNHHHEHHLFPTVPFYHLPLLHARIAEEVSKRNPEVYAAGYFAAAFRTLTHPLPHFRPTPLEGHAL